MPQGLRKFVLTAHVIASVSWLGAVAGFLVLAIVGLTSRDAQLIPAVYLVAKPLTSFAIVPLALASLLTGLVQSLGTRWGLFQHYWVLIKFLLTVLATLILVQYTQTVSYFAGIAATTNAADLGGLQSYLLHSSGALLILLVTTILSVYKPRGLTPYGWRRQREVSQ
jgi:uncharacterized membrane protein